MADNTVLPAGTADGDTYASDDISGVKYQRVKLVLGADGVNGGDVASSNPLPISDAGGSLTVDGTVAVSGTVAVTDNSGSLTVDAPVGTPVFVRLSDGAAAISTLPISAASLPLPSGAATAAKQPALGTAGSPSADVLTVQGATSGAPLTIVEQNVSVTGQGSQTTLNNNVILATAGSGSYDAAGYSSIALQIIPAAGTVTAGAITFEGSNDNSNWQAIALYDVNSLTAAPVTSYSLAASTNRMFVGPLPTRYVRARISTGVTGTTTGVQCHTALRPELWVNPTQTVVSATGTNLAANVSHMNGVAVTMGAGASGTGVQRVAIATDGQGQIVDNAAFTDGTTRLDMAGYIFDETAGTALTENDAAAARINANRAQVATLEDYATRARGITVKAASTVAASTDTALVVAVNPLDPISAILSAGVVTCTTDITRPADTTAYAAGDALSNSTSAPTSGGFAFTGAARASGKSGVINDVIVTSSNAAGGLQGEIWIFDSATTNVNDNSAFAISDAEAKTLVAKIPFSLTAGTNNATYHGQSLGIGYTTVGSADLRYLVRVAAAYTPASAEVITCRLKCMQVN